MKMEWTQCIICQQITTEPLRCPLNAHGIDKSAPAVYVLFLRNVTHFRELNSLPVPLNFISDITVDDLIRNTAQWHKSCHSQFNTNRLERVRKRKRDSTPEGRKQRPRQLFDKTSRIFCMKSDGLLHEFITLGTEHNVKKVFQHPNRSSS